MAEDNFDSVTVLLKAKKEAMSAEAGDTKADLQDRVIALDKLYKLRVQYERNQLQPPPKSQVTNPLISIQDNPKVRLYLHTPFFLSD